MASSLNGTGLTFSTGATLNSPPVTSIATGNGLSGGTITTTGTLAIACPTHNTVGSYALMVVAASSGYVTATFGNNYSAGSSGTYAQAAFISATGCGLTYSNNNILSGTWKYLGGNTSGSYSQAVGIGCRVA